MSFAQDPLVKQAILEQYRCRSAFKLIELDDKYRIFRKGSIVVGNIICLIFPIYTHCVFLQIDCGAKPGIYYNSVTICSEY